MKKFLKTSVAFSVFALILYSCLLVLNKRFLPQRLMPNTFKYDTASDFTATRLQEADSTKNVDLLILGSSHAYRGYDTEFLAKQTGLSTFNLGTSAQTLKQTEILLDRYISTLNPKYVLLDIYPALLDNDGIESMCQLLSVEVLNKNMVYEALCTFDIRVYNTLLYTLINKFFHFSSDFRDKSIPGEKYVKGGYVRSYRAQYENTTFASSSLKISEEQEASFARIINMLKDRNIKYIILQAPLPKERYSSYLNNDELDATLKGFGKYYNFNKEKSLPHAFFMDQSHINAKGVYLYNKYVLEKFKTIYQNTNLSQN
jgi:hypothetical protein